MGSKRTHGEAGFIAVSETFLGYNPGKLEQVLIGLYSGICKPFVNTPLEDGALAQVTTTRKRPQRAPPLNRQPGSLAVSHAGRAAFLLTPDRRSAPAGRGNR